MADEMMPEGWTDLKDPTWEYWFADEPKDRNPVDGVDDVIIEGLDSGEELAPLYRATELATETTYTRDELFAKYPDLVKKWRKS